MLRKPPLLLIVLSLLINGYVPASAQNNRFKNFLELAKLTYIAPEGYREILTSTQFLPVKSASSVLLHIIENESKGIAIGFTVIPYIPASSANPLYNFNQSWKHAHQADTSQYPIKYFDKKRLYKLNADTAVKYDLKMNREFLEKYNRCKAVVMHKNNIGTGYVYYFYNNGNEKLVEREIRRTNTILKFQPETFLTRIP